MFGTPFVKDKRLLDAGTGAAQRKQKMQFHIVFCSFNYFNFKPLFFAQFQLFQFVHRIFTALFTRILLQSKETQP
ncbi:hypothetical protein A9D60_06830 [Leisingera sp. JC1]|nr:hypothetical protein A9D60_06830 [Leisingera sp. JC1]